MTTAGQPDPAVPADAARSQIPPSLARKAPSRVEVTDEAGRVLFMSSRRTYIGAGQQVRLRVLQQPPEVGQAQAEVEFAFGAGLRPDVRPHPVNEGPVRAFVAHVRAYVRGRIPWPRQTRIHISVRTPGSEAFTLAVPLVIWPSWKAAAVVAVSAALSLVSARVLEGARTVPPLRAVFDVYQDAAFLGQVVAFGVLAATGLQLLWRCAVWSELTAGDGE